MAHSSHGAAFLGLAELAEELERLARGASSGLEPVNEDAREAAFAIEQTIEDALAPLIGQKASHSYFTAEAALRLALVNSLGWREALRIRNEIAAPQRPVYVCRGNPVFGPERFDVLGPPGCRVIFRGQWRRSRLGREGVMGREHAALGPRCGDCRKKMTAELDRLQVRRRRRNALT